MVIAVVNANVAILLIMHYGNQLPRQQKFLTVNTMETAFELIKRNSEVTELKCFVCGMKTGCNDVNIYISKYSICKGCMKQEEAFDNYKQSFAAKTMNI